MVLRYAAAVAVPAVLSLGWYRLPPPWSNLPFSILIITIAAIVRFFGDGPGIVSI
ncbi:MAG: hypothetical protein JWO56_3737, partial [Acidobacteria bacterium]|nr:hypothetical protein [Acidobacteriota bacterium]